ncbi:hypothetical protein YPPY64_2764, partial [Yersinia pestis PY-64]
MKLFSLLWLFAGWSRYFFIYSTNLAAFLQLAL